MCHQLDFSPAETASVIVASVVRSATSIDAAPYFTSAVTFAAVVVIAADVPQINY